MSFQAGVSSMPGVRVSFKDFFGQQRDGMQAMATTGVIGLHLVSGPLVGFAIGYGLDVWLGTSPWCKIIFLLVGIGAGFLNVYRDTQTLLRKLEKERRVSGGENDSNQAQTQPSKEGFLPDSEKISGKP